MCLLRGIAHFVLDGLDKEGSVPMSLQEKNPIDVLRSINYLDSSAFGIEINVFGITLLISARNSPNLMDFGFSEPHGDIRAEFRQVRDLSINISKSNFCPPYLGNGELAAVDLLDFASHEIKIGRVGATGETDRLGEYRELRDIYEVQFVFPEAELNFKFVNLNLSTFDPLNFAEHLT